MQIHVTWKDILGGVRNDPFRCALALAVQRETGASAVAGRTRLDIWTPSEVTTHILPAKAARKVRFFDRFGLIRPFAFELPAPAHVVSVKQSQPAGTGIKQLVLAAAA